MYLLLLTTIALFNVSLKSSANKNLSLLSLENIEALSNDEQDKDKDKKYCKQESKNEKDSFYGKPCGSNDRYKTNYAYVTQFSCEEGGTNVKQEQFIRETTVILITVKLLHQVNCRLSLDVNL